MTAIEYPGVLFSAEEDPRCFVLVLQNEADLRVHRLRTVRSGALRRFLVVDSTGRRFAGEATGTGGIDLEQYRQFGAGSMALTAVFGVLSLNPPVALRYRLEPDGYEPLGETKGRIYRYLQLNPSRYTWAPPASLRERVARAKNMDELVGRFIAD